MTKLTRRQRLRIRHRRLRKKIFGTPARPRLHVKRSLKHIEASLIDDIAGKTLLSVSTKALSFAIEKKETKTEQATRLGSLIGRKAIDSGIEKVLFDRGGNPYHGRIKALAESARSAGLKF